MNWHPRIIRDLSLLPDFVDYYNNELTAAKVEVKIKGKLEQLIAALPGITEQRFRQLQDVEAVLEHLNIKLQKIKSDGFKKYLENYNRALSSRDATLYVEGEQDVIDMMTLINEVALLRNKFLSIMKGLETKQWQMGHIVKLRTAGMEDVVID